MERSPALRRALRKWEEYVKKYERYKSLFFAMKVEKWREETLKLSRQEWDLFAAQRIQQQKEKAHANVSAVL